MDNEKNAKLRDKQFYFGKWTDGCSPKSKHRNQEQYKESEQGC